MTDPLNSLARWESWQETVRAALPLFATSPFYVAQEVDPSEMEQVVQSISNPVDVDGKVRDVPHGALVFQTSLGDVTRTWVDGQVEIDFLRRTLPVSLASCDVLDIGAGYGRLAAMLAPLVRSYTCVDPVPVSVEVCRTYTQLYAPSVQVLDVAGLRTAMTDATLHPTLAVNIHSWNECTRAQIDGWLDVLAVLEVPFLFTVSHTETWYAWEGGMPTFKPLLNARYDLIREESLGLGPCPYALWVRR